MDRIKTISDLDSIFEEKGFDIIQISLKQLIFSTNQMNNVENKKLLKHLLTILLEYIIKLLQEENAINFIHKFSLEIVELCFMFPEIINNFFSHLLKEFITLIPEEYPNDYKGNESNFVKETIVNNDKIFRKIVNSISLVSYLTLKLNQPNQMLSNYIMLINSFISKIQIFEEHDYPLFAFKLYLCGMMGSIAKNINSYIPKLIYEIEQLWNEVNSFKFDKDNYDPDIMHEKVNFFKIMKNSIPLEHDQNNYITLMNTLTKVTEEQMQLYKSDINFDIIFQRIMNLIKYNQYISVNPGLIKTILQVYESAIEIMSQRKNVHINFMVLKKKSIPSLEPLYDLDFLGGIYRDQNRNQAKTSKAIAKKVKNTEKQAIRNVKKEGKMIDAQRRVRYNKMAEKKKDEMKQSNQFIEQQNIEAKKLATEQGKKRYKFKNKKFKSK
jgi:hypothetical protein